jgi:hypothetical protein
MANESAFQNVEYNPLYGFPRRQKNAIKGASAGSI